MNWRNNNKNWLMIVNNLKLKINVKINNKKSN